MVSSSASIKQGKPAQRLDEVEVWRSIVDSWKKLQRGAEKNLVTNVDISVAELKILRVLREEGTSPMNRFCAATMLSGPTITGIVDKLEERGYAERVRSKEDRREVLIAITPKGTSILQKGEELHRKFVERSLSVLKDEEVGSLDRLLRKLADGLDSFPPA